MPILKSAKKALKVAKRRKTENDTLKKKVRNAQKAFRTSPSVEALRSAFSTIDTATKKHLMHKNKAARLKSQLSKLLSK
jgi:small subunit ribosomal protein S20